MDFSLSEHHELLRKTVRDFARNSVLPHARKWDEEERFPKEIVPKLAGPNCAAGAPKFVVFSRLNTSKRNSTERSPPNPTRRITARSTSL